MTSLHNVYRKIRYSKIKAWRMAKRKGVFFLFTRLVNKIPYLTFRTSNSIWFEKRLNIFTDPVVPGANISVDFLVQDKIKLINWLKQYQPRFPWMYLHKEMQTARTDNHIFAVIFLDDMIIGYCKIGMNHIYIHDFDKIICFPEKMAFIYDTFVLPQYRGMHAALYAVIKIMQYLKEQRYYALWCHIEEWNRASLAVFQKAGFQRRGMIRFCRLFGVPFFIKNKYNPMLNLKSFIRVQN